MENIALLLQLAVHVLTVSLIIMHRSKLRCIERPLVSFGAFLIAGFSASTALRIVLMYPEALESVHYAESLLWGAWGAVMIRIRGNISRLFPKWA